MTSIKATLITPDGRRDVTRRFMADADVISSYTGLSGKISQIFPGLTPDNFALYWKDADGDFIIMSSDEEVHLALTFVQPEGTLNMFIKDKGSPDQVHPGVVCDGCDGPIYGRRYKCAVCYDFDLCASCDGKGTHPDHPMIRIATPIEPCFQRSMPRPCGMGGPRRRFCPRFRAGPGGPCGYRAFAENNPFMQNLPQMAETIMKNWSEAMRPQPPKTDQPETGESEKETKDDGEKGTNVGEFDPQVFSALMDEISGNFCEAFKTMGGKRRASKEEESKAGEQPQEKQSRVGEGSSPGGATGGACSGGQFDFKQLEEMMRPLVGNFFQAMGGPTPSTSRQGADQGHQEEGQEARPDQPRLEEVLRPWADMWQNFAASSQKAHTGASDSQGAPPSASCGPSGDNPQGQAAAQNLFEMMSGMFQQFGVNPNPDSTESCPTAPQATTPSTPSQSSEQMEGQDPVTDSKQTAQTESTEKKFNFRNPEKPEDQGAKSEDSRVARSLAQLKSMGFTDDGGWLTSLLEAKNGDVGRVLDVILPPRA